jgi:hypothetical protein
MESQGGSLAQLDARLPTEPKAGTWNQQAFLLTKNDLGMGIQSFDRSMSMIKLYICFTLVFMIGISH